MVPSAVKSSEVLFKGSKEGGGGREAPGHHEELQAMRSQLAALHATVSRQAEEMAGLRKLLEERETPQLKPSETEEPREKTEDFT
eukprot:318101-Hanusia_phi.AAC.1